jgi:hypothetical protein
MDHSLFIVRGDGWWNIGTNIKKIVVSLNPHDKGLNPVKFESNKFP